MIDLQAQTTPCWSISSSICHVWGCQQLANTSRASIPQCHYILQYVYIYIHSIHMLYTSCVNQTGDFWKQSRCFSLQSSCVYCSAILRNPSVGRSAFIGMISRAGAIACLGTPKAMAWLSFVFDFLKGDAPQEDNRWDHPSSAHLDLQNHCRSAA